MCLKVIHTNKNRILHLWTGKKNTFFTAVLENQRERYIHYILISKIMLTGVMSGAVHT